MLTLKLFKGPDFKIVEATEVNVRNVGKPKEPVVAPEGYLTDSIREIRIVMWNESPRFYYVSDGPVIPETCSSTHIVDGEEPFEVYDHAFIENAHGATTGSVHAG